MTRYAKFERFTEKWMNAFFLGLSYAVIPALVVVVVGLVWTL